MIRTALDQCTDSKLYVAMNLAFACSLRMGEILGQKDVYHVFTSLFPSTRIILKKPKTDSNIRKVWLPRVVFHSLRLQHDLLDEDWEVNAQKFEDAFYASTNPGLRTVRPPKPTKPKESERPAATPFLDLAGLVAQLQKSPELVSTLAATFPREQRNTIPVIVKQIAAINRRKPDYNSYFGTPEGNRTPSLTLRRGALYPIELLAHMNLCKKQFPDKNPAC